MVFQGSGTLRVSYLFVDSVLPVASPECSKCLMLEGDPYVDHGPIVLLLFLPDLGSYTKL